MVDTIHTRILPQGVELTPIMFIITITDPGSNLSLKNYLNMFEADVKFQKKRNRHEYVPMSQKINK